MYIWVQYSLDDLVGANTLVIGTNYKIFYWAAGCAMRGKQGDIMWGKGYSYLTNDMQEVDQ